jgi:hypothetical protein
LWLLPLLIPLLIVWLRPLAMSGVVMLDEDQQPKSPIATTGGGGARTPGDETRPARAVEEHETR